MLNNRLCGIVSKHDCTSTLAKKSGLSCIFRLCNDVLNAASLGSMSPTEKSELPNLSGRND
jgi:hypothetical protein